MANLLGIDTNRIISLTFVIGAALAAVAGVLLGMPVRRCESLYRIHRWPQSLHSSRSWWHRGIPSAMLGALILGISEIMTAAYFSSI